MKIALDAYLKVCVTWTTRSAAPAKNAGGDQQSDRHAVEAQRRSTAQAGRGPRGLESEDIRNLVSAHLTVVYASRVISAVQNRFGEALAEKFEISNWDDAADKITEAAEDALKRRRERLVGETVRSGMIFRTSCRARSTTPPSFSFATRFRRGHAPILTRRLIGRSRKFSAASAMSSSLPSYWKGSRPIRWSRIC